MSDAELHRVAVGSRMVEAIPLVDRLTGLAVPGTRNSVEAIVMDGSHAIPRYREITPPAVVTNFELHIPAEHVAAYVAVLDPIITDPKRRQPHLGVDDGAGGRHISVHGTEPAALDALAPLPSVPVEFTAWDVPADEFDWRLVPTEHAPTVRACVEWSVMWPAVADLGLHSHTKHAAVCLLANTANYWDLDAGEPGYRVYLSTEPGGAPRAAHLAAAAGLTVLSGPNEY